MEEKCWGVRLERGQVGSLADLPIALQLAAGASGVNEQCGGLPRTHPAFSPPEQFRGNRALSVQPPLTAHSMWLALKGVCVRGGPGGKTALVSLGAPHLHPLTLFHFQQVANTPKSQALSN